MAGSVQVEIRVRLKQPGDVKVTQTALRQGVESWVRSGEEPEGFRIVAVFWGHNGRKMKSATDSGAIEEVRARMLSNFPPFYWRVSFERAPKVREGADLRKPKSVITRL